MWFVLQPIFFMDIKEQHKVIVQMVNKNDLGLVYKKSVVLYFTLFAFVCTYLHVRSNCDQRSVPEVLKKCQRFQILFYMLAWELCKCKLIIVWLLFSTTTVYINTAIKLTCICDIEQ